LPLGFGIPFILKGFEAEKYFYFSACCVEFVELQLSLKVKLSLKTTETDAVRVLMIQRALSVQSLAVACGVTAQTMANQIAAIHMHRAKRNGQEFGRWLLKNIARLSAPARQGNPQRGACGSFFLAGLRFWPCQWTRC
jgi:hypothetical protein